MAFINKKSLRIIKDFLGMEVSDSELAKKIVAFKSDTEIFYDKGDPAIHIRNGIFAIKNNCLFTFNNSFQNVINNGYSKLFKL